MRNSNPQSPIPNPKSPRRGVTIVEVLFAILVTSVGLLGAIAIFPVASAQAKKARQNDTVAHTGRSSMHMFDAYEMRNPEKWYEWVVVASVNQFQGIPLPSSLGVNSFCLDSRFVVANASGSPTATPWSKAKFFPYTPFDTTNFATASAQMTRVAFFPGTLRPGSAADATDQFDRANSGNRNKFLADSLFMFDDDLLSMRPGLDDVSKLGFANDRSIPAIQQFDGGFSSPQKRQSLGKLSWMATLVPRVDLATGLASDEYIVSIVVFNDRSSDLTLSTFATMGNENLLERTVGMYAYSGEGGGEVLLYWPASSSNANLETAKERLKLRANNWILLSGSTTTVTATPITVNKFQWYRVTQCDAEVEFAAATAAAPPLPAFPDRYQLYASLIGPDFEKTPTNTNVFTQATLIDGVAAVYEKTIRLDAN